MSANRANEGLKLLKTAKWHEWQKQAILEVAENPVFLEPDTHGKLEDLVLEADILFGSPDFSPAIWPNPRPSSWSMWGPQVWTGT